jgi:hypothetical protein
MGLEIDDILGDSDSPKKKNSKNKGKRGELQLVNLLNKRFESQEFSRVVGSGNRWSHVAYAKKDYIGDVVCPDDFRFCIECKFGYAEIELVKALDGGDRQLDEFLTQAEDDAKRAKKSPLLCWKKDRRPFLVFIKAVDLPHPYPSNDFGAYYMRYRNWTIFTLSSLLELPDKFFFG